MSHKPFKMFDGKITYSRISRPPDGEPIDPEILRAFQRRFEEQLEQTLFPTPPESRSSDIVDALNMVSIYESPIIQRLMRQVGPKLVICSLGDALKVSRLLRRNGSSFKRIHKGYWRIVDKKNGWTLMQMNITKACEDDKMLVMDLPKSSLF